jgi:hypothetical protein
VKEEGRSRGEGGASVDQHELVNKQAVTSKNKQGRPRDQPHASIHTTGGEHIKCRMSTLRARMNDESTTRAFTGVMLWGCASSPRGKQRGSSGRKSKGVP